MNEETKMNEGWLYGLATIIIFLGLEFSELSNVTNAGKTIFGMFIVLLGLILFWLIAEIKGRRKVRE